MAKARKILRHANAIRNISTVTKTMAMVSTARFKKTHDLAAAARPYTGRLSEMMADAIARSQGEMKHPLLEARDSVKTDVLLVLTSHRGLCGAYNSSIVRLALERRRQLLDAGYRILVRCSGRRGCAALRGRGCELDRQYTQFDYLPRAADVTALGDELIAEFLGGQIGGLEVAYMQFLSSGKQRPAIAQILPLSELEPPRKLAATEATPAPYEYLPSPESVLADLVPASVRLKLYQCFLDAAVSEQIARMTAMQAASENAQEMIHDLTVQYNRARQSQITTELAEIMGGAEGLK